MIDDATSVPDGAVLERDVCVIGGGAAGLTIALELEDAGCSVLVLESGGTQLEAATQSLYAGPAPDGVLSRHADYLRAGRLRFLGGSTNHWAGFCAPLDPIDFGARAWVPDSGWPIGPETLEPFWSRAARWLQIPGVDARFDADPRRPVDLAPSLETHTYRMSPPTRFGEAWRAPLEASRRVTVLLHANAVDFAFDASPRRVDTVRVATLDGGPRFSVRARQFVLATGAIENARLLLNADAVHPGGIGNQNDLVGRYFLEHVYAMEGIGLAFLAPLPDGLPLYTHIAATDPGHPDVRRLGVFSLTPAQQRERRLLNHQVRLFVNRGDAALGPLSSAVASVAARMAEAPDGAPLVDPLERQVAFLEIASEIAPSRDNRVALTDERDALGLRRVALHCRLGELERRSIDATLGAFANAVGGSLQGRVRLHPERARRYQDAVPGYHQMGTTRMQDDPKRGVVDRDGVVHGVDNLTLAGSSVFPTAGRVNPTWTLVALAVRTADRLRAEVAT